MPRKARLYLPLDVDFFDNQRVLNAGEPAGWLFLAMCCKAKALMSDGFLSKRQVASLLVPSWQKRLVKLVQVGLVEVVVEGETWLITGFTERNKSADEIARDRATDLARKQEQAAVPAGFLSGSGAVPVGTIAVSGRNLREVEEKKREVEAEHSEAETEGPGRAAFTEMRSRLRNKQSA